MAIHKKIDMNIFAEIFGQAIFSSKALPYMQYLLEIYGKEIVESLIEWDKDCIRLTKNIKILEKLKPPTQTLHPTCSNCKDFYDIITPRDLSFQSRNMDFPSWANTMDFSKPHRKEIMILGESVTWEFSSGTDKTLSKNRKINFTYDFGTFVQSVEQVNSLEKKSDDFAVFWKKMKYFFGELFTTEKFLEKLYLTDIAHCCCADNQILYFPCAREFLFREITLIQPKYIVIQGDSAYNTFLQLASNIFGKNNVKLRSIKIQLDSIKGKNGNEKKRNFYIGENGLNKRAANFILNAKTIEVLSIPHTSNTSGVYNHLNDVWGKIGLDLQAINYWEKLDKE